MPEISHDARPVFYTVKEAAEILRVGASTLYRIIREGTFPPSGCGLGTSYLLRFWTASWRKSKRQAAWSIRRASRRTVVQPARCRNCLTVHGEQPSTPRSDGAQDA